MCVRVFTTYYDEISQEDFERDTNGWMHIINEWMDRWMDKWTYWT